MSLPTYGGAIDEILGLFYEAWKVGTPALNGGSIVTVLWPGIPEPESPPPTEPFARVRYRHTSNSGQTLAPKGSRRVTREGLVTIQILVPFIDGGGLTLSQNLAIIARDSFEGVGTPSGIWFRDTHIREIGPTDGMFQHNVLSAFTYDELR